MELKRAYKDVFQQTSGIMGVFCLLSLIFISLSIYYSRFRIKQTFQEEIKTLKGELSEARADANKENAALVTYQKRVETHQATCQSHKNFQTSFFAGTPVGRKIRYLHVR